MLIFVQLLVLSCDGAVLHMLYCAPPGPPDCSATRYESVGTSFEFTRDKNRLPETNGGTSAFALVSCALEIPDCRTQGIESQVYLKSTHFRTLGIKSQVC